MKGLSEDITSYNSESLRELFSLSYLLFFLVLESSVLLSVSTSSSVLEYKNIHVQEPNEGESTQLKAQKDHLLETIFDYCATFINTNHSDDSFLGSM